MVKKVIQVISIVIGVLYNSLYVLLIGFIVTNAISFFINFFYSRKVLGSVNKYEILLTIKIFIIGALFLLVFSYIRDNFQLLNGMSFVYMLLIIPCYLLVLQIFNILNVVDHLKELKRIL